MERVLVKGVEYQKGKKLAKGGQGLVFEGEASDGQEKMKNPTYWQIPEKEAIIATFPTSNKPPQKKFLMKNSKK